MGTRPCPSSGTSKPSSQPRPHPPPQPNCGQLRPFPLPPPPRAHGTPGSSPAAPSLCPPGTRSLQSFPKNADSRAKQRQGLGGTLRTAAGCTTGQAPTCLGRVARTRRPSGWGTGQGRRRYRPPPPPGRGWGGRPAGLGHLPRPRRTLCKPPWAAATPSLLSRALLAPELWASPPLPTPPESEAQTSRDQNLSGQAAGPVPADQEPLTSPPPAARSGNGWGAPDVSLTLSEGPTCLHHLSSG